MDKLIINYAPVGMLMKKADTPNIPISVDEIVDDAYPDLDLEIDPKLSWALRHPEKFPLDVDTADYRIIDGTHHATCTDVEMRELGSK